MPRATRDIWQGHPSTQAWKLDQLLPDRVTELHGAAWSGDIEHIKVLISRGSNVAARDKAGCLPLHYAAEGNQAGAIMQLISHKANIHTKNDVGDSALHTAAAQGSLAAIQALLAQGADPSASNDQEQTPLYKAVEAKQAACAQILCQAGPHAVNKADEWGLCPLHIAARAGDVDIVTLLLLAQADPMQQAWDNRSPLHFAAQHRYPAVIRQLLLHPSLQETPSSATQHPSGSAMQHPPMQPVLQQHQHAPDAEQHQDQDMAEDALLSDALPQVQVSHNAQTDTDSKQILQQADRYDEHASIQDAASSLQSLQSGIQYEPNPGAIASEETDTTSDGTLDDAEQLDYTGQDAEALQALLALTNDCSVQSPPRAHNPADRFRWQQQLLRLKDHQGNTALHLAVIEGLPESVQLLLQAGADTDTPGMQLETPAMMARKFGHTDIAEMLSQVGGR